MHITFEIIYARNVPLADKKKNMRQQIPCYTKTKTKLGEQK